MRLAALALVLCSPGTAAMEEFSVPVCQRPSRKEYVFGISGAAGNGTDDFGRDNLIALSDGAEHSSLFAARPSTSSARPQTGVYQNPLAAPALLERLALRPELSVRVVLTGHGSPDGIFLGVGSDEKERRLTPAVFAAAVVKARKAGKRIKADFLACFSGSFMPAVMPGEGLAPACGVASTLPEKMAEGCYQDGSSAPRDDYAAAAASLDDCRPGRDWRLVHAAVFERLKSYDIPMLSSDYFLLYGPAAERLGRVPLAPYPGRTLVRKELAGGAVVYLDLINARVVAARGPKGPLPLPRVSIIDCPESVDDGDNVVDGTHHSGFYLHRNVGETAWPAPDCVPTVRLDWPDGASPSAVVEMAALPGDDAYDPDRPEDPVQRDIRRDLTPMQRRVPVEGLKPGARLLLIRLLPAFDDGMKGRELADALKALAAEVEARDPIRGRSMRALITAMWVKDGAREGVHDGTRFHGRWMRTYLADLFSETETNVDNLDYSRLSFLAATAISERELRKEAARDEKARRLVADLDALRTCEKTFR